MKSYSEMKQRIIVSLDQLRSVADPLKVSQLQTKLHALDFQLNKTARSTLAFQSVFPELQWQQASKVLDSITSEINTLVQQQHKTTSVPVPQREYQLSMQCQQLKQQADELGAELEAAKRHVTELETAIRNQAWQLPLPKLLAITNDVLTRYSDEDLLAVDNELRSLYFHLRSTLETLCVLPIADLERIKSSVTRLDSMELRLMYYREKLERAADEQERNIWLMLRDKEIHHTLNS